MSSPTTSQPPPRHTAEYQTPNDEFLFRLYRGSEMLAQDRIMEAKEHLERALAIQPQDAQAQDLLAGVHFRLGSFPDAIEIWTRLVEAYPSDARLRTHLALASLKAGQAETASAHIQHALEARPDDRRLWGYLGLIHWQRGELEDARQAFVRSGQATIADRVEEFLVSSTNELTSGAEEGARAAARAAVRSAAELAVKEFETDQVNLRLEAPVRARTSGRWIAIEPGRDAVASLHSLGVGGKPPGLKELMRVWAVALPEDTSFGIGNIGELIIQTLGTVHSRLQGMQALCGALPSIPLKRRARGKEQPEVLGGDNPLMTLTGPVHGVIPPAEDGHFISLRLLDDLLYIQEKFLWAFEANVNFECGSLPLGNRSLSLVQLSGRGICVMSVPRTPLALSVISGEDFHVDPESLIGWVGRMFPAGQEAGLVTLRGEGTVIVTG